MTKMKKIPMKQFHLTLHPPISHAKYVEVKLRFEESEGNYFVLLSSVLSSIKPGKIPVSWIFKELNNIKVGKYFIDMLKHSGVINKCNLLTFITLKQSHYSGKEEESLLSTKNNALALPRK